MGLTEGLAVRSNIAAYQGYANKADRASFERPVNGNGGGSTMGAGAYSEYGISYAGGNRSSRGAYEPSIYDRGSGNLATYPGNTGKLLGMVMQFMTGVDVIGRGITQWGQPAPRLNEYSNLQQSPAYGRTDVFNPHQGSEFGGGFAMAGAPMRGGGAAGYGISSGAPYAVQDLRARQMASAQGGGFAGMQGADQPFIRPTGINVNNDTTGKSKTIHDLVEEFNAKEGGGASVDIDAAGNIAVIFDSKLSRDKFLFKEYNAKLNAIKAGTTATTAAATEAEKKKKEDAIASIASIKSKEVSDALLLIQLNDAIDDYGVNSPQVQKKIKSLLNSTTLSPADKAKLITTLRSLELTNKETTALIDNAAKIDLVKNQIDKLKTEADAAAKAPAPAATPTPTPAPAATAPAATPTPAPAATAPAATPTAADLEAQTEEAEHRAKALANHNLDILENASNTYVLNEAKTHIINGLKYYTKDERAQIKAELETKMKTQVEGWGTQQLKNQIGTAIVSEIDKLN